VRPDRHPLRTGGAVAAAAVALAVSAPALPPLSGVRGWLAGATPDQALAGMAAILIWAGVTWMLAGLGSTAAGRLPGRVGAVCACTAGRLMPGVLRRATELLLGVSIAATPELAASAAPAAHGGPPHIGLDRVPVVASLPHHRSRTVQPGECLWSITADLLGDDSSDRSVARDWPGLYAANRAVIGDDPDLIRPGQRLRIPAGLR
jgi:nucleoid-associated protein YgaU